MLASPSRLDVLLHCLKNNILVKIIVIIMISTSILLSAAYILMYATQISYDLAIVWILAGMLSIASIIGFVAALIHNIRHNIPYIRFECSRAHNPEHNNGTISWLFMFALLSYIPTWITTAYLVNNDCKPTWSMTCHDSFVENTQLIAFTIILLGPMLMIISGIFMLFCVRMVLAMTCYCCQEYHIAALNLGSHMSASDADLTSPPNSTVPVDV